MSTYIIGDVQGCYNSLMKLLDQIHYDPSADKLGFVGDLVNRGSQSLATLRFIKNEKNTFSVLGNHDCHLLAVGFDQIPKKDSDTFSDILNADDKMELLHWLRQCPFIYFDDSNNYLVVHAGIPPQWSIPQSIHCANEAQRILTGDNYLNFLKHMHGDHPDDWNDHHQGFDRWRYIVNAFTRLRFCDKNGKLDLTNKTNQPTHSNIKPWFDWRSDNEKTTLIFGHWASLEGKCHKKNYYALDTGCVWNGRITALRIEDKKLFSMAC